MSKRKILVTSNFIQATQSIQNYLSEYSNENAAKFTNALKTKLQKVVTYPEGYPPIRKLPTKKNWYRFALFQIIYKVTSTQLIFLMLIHTKQNTDLEDLRKGKYS
jgi:hypothetical protein